MFALWAAGGDFFGVAAGVANEYVGVGMKRKWKITIWTKRLPTAAFTNGKRSGAATVMKYQGLTFCFEIFFDAR